MMANNVEYLCSRFCEGLTQDYDLSFSSPREMVQFCLGFLTKDEATCFAKAMSEVASLEPSAMLRLWNSSCNDVYFRNETAAAGFTSMILENMSD